jgi:hypothetical protein
MPFLLWNLQESGVHDLGSQSSQHSEAHSDSQLLQVLLLDNQQTASFGTEAAVAAAAAAAAAAVAAAPDSNCAGNSLAFPAAASASSLQAAHSAELCIPAAGVPWRCLGSAAAQPAQIAGKGTAELPTQLWPPGVAAAPSCDAMPAAGDAWPAVTDLKVKVQGVRHSHRRGRARKKLHSSIRRQQELQRLEDQHQVGWAPCAQCGLHSYNKNSVFTTEAPGLCTHNFTSTGCGSRYTSSRIAVLQGLCR